MLSMSEYQTKALRTMPPAEDIPASQAHLLLAGLGAADEAGELAGLVKKHVFHKHPLDREHVKKEVGDVLWYLALAMKAIGGDLEEAGLTNIQKLLARYPEGFDPERSLNRAPGDV